MYKTGAVALNNIGGGINIWVDHLPSVGESVLGYGFDVAEDLAKGGNVAVAIARLGMDENAALEPEKTLRALQEKYQTENVIMTMGGEGYAGLEKEHYFSGAQIPVSPIVDTSGAGDGFLSAMVANLHWGKSLEEACRWANKYAARVVLVDGTLKGYSTVEELEAFYRERGESL